MQVMTNRFLSNENTDKIVNMILEKLPHASTIIEIDLKETGFASVTWTYKTDLYNTVFEYNINKVDFITGNKIGTLA